MWGKGQERWKKRAGGTEWRRKGGSGLLDKFKSSNENGAMRRFLWISWVSFGGSVPQQPKSRKKKVNIALRSVSLGSSTCYG